MYVGKISIGDVYDKVFYFWNVWLDDVGVFGLIKMFLWWRIVVFVYIIIVFVYDFVRK